MNTVKDAKSIFLAAAERQSVADRAAYLDDVCGDDLGLRQRVEALLKAHDEPGSFLEKPAIDPAAFSPTVDVQSSSESPSDQIGPYKLLQQIGEGGMGVVYLAEQQEPVRRKVALKIIKPGMDSRQVIARFEAERQALAMMEHQNIARVLDASMTETGRPYFVMELVKGVPITEYCDKNQLTPSERLELFIPICHAVQHAHQKGIIHRDLKPSNILVCLYDGRPTPKVIDFGVAKATQQRLTEKTMFTQHGQVVGTLEYMSPEQAEMNQLDVDTRGDIYSLGVVLYELLTGSTPITKEQLRDAGFMEMLRLIRESEPEKPSTRVSNSREALPSISAQRRTEPAKLNALIRGELDWIVMKALEKDRTRRYATASDFAKDVQRYLEDEPVEACPPSTWYLARKRLRKHKTLIATCALIGALMCVSLAVYRREAIRAMNAEALAVAEFERARFAEQQTREQLQEVIRQKERAETAEQQATRQRDLALTAEAQARENAAQAAAAEQQAEETLARSLFEQARSVRLAARPGRRETALGLLQQAEELRNRRTSDPTAKDESRSPLPSEAELRSEAVASLLLADGKVARSWDGYINSCSPNGRFVATSRINVRAGRASLQVVDTLDGREVWKSNESQVEFAMVLAVDADGGRLATFSAPGTQSVKLIDLPSGQATKTLELPSGSRSESIPLPTEILNGLQFSPDGRWLLGTRMQVTDAELLLWDLTEDSSSEARVIATVRHRPQLNPAFSPDGRWLAWADDQNEVTLWKLVEGEQRSIQLPLAIDAAVAFGTDTHHLVVHGHDANDDGDGRPVNPGTVLIWNVEENREVRRFSTSPMFIAMAISASPGGRRVAVGQMNGTLLVFDLDDDGTIRLDHGGLPQSLAWTSDGRHLISAGLGVCRLWELTLETPLSVHPLQSDHPREPLIQFAISPDGRLAAAENTRSDAVELHELPSGRAIKQFELARPSGLLEARLLFSPDGQHLVRSGFNGVTVWDMDGDGEPVRMDENEVFRGSMVTSVGFGTDGKLLVGGFDRFRPAVKEALSGEVVWQSDKEQRRALPRVSPDGSLVTFHTEEHFGGNRTIEVRELPAGRIKHRIASAFEGFDFQTRLVISPDNRWLIEIELSTSLPFSPGPGSVLSQSRTASFLGETDASWKAAVWELDSGEPHMHIGSDSKADGMAFSSNGRYLAVSQRNGRMIVCDLEGKQQLFDWQAWPGSADLTTSTRDVLFTADGRSLVVADEARTALRMLDLDRLRTELSPVGLAWQ